MSAKTRSLFYIVFIVLSLTLIFALSVSYIAIARSAQAMPAASAHTAINTPPDGDLSLHRIVSDQPPPSLAR